MKHFLQLISSLAILSCQSDASQLEERQFGCTAPLQRRSWTSLTPASKRAYLDAERCLIDTPAQYGVPGARTVWDELQYSHVRQSNHIHGVGQFLPWHRYYMKAHETLLQKHCGYQGGVPYWAEAEHASNIRQSPIWDAELGFGGDGTGADGCISTGPFANVTLVVNADSAAGEPYCLRRAISVNDFQNAGQSYIDDCFAIPDYWPAMSCYGLSPHWSGHAGTGGVMADAMLAPGDPIFFLHHTNLDRLYSLWQRADPGRYTEIGGPNLSPEFNGMNNWPMPGPEITEHDGDPSGVTTLDHVLWMVGILPNVTIRDVLDPRGGVICAEYV
ncbi:Tyrosinase ustQ [Fulvia fulva]|uniref:Tyrosinase ustQ n=1 Tax=Passalora fulva TaxID=5499 RepID=A0A9Q8PBS8_PASFU|nr:Tyrosinase ustQ [Fulvia fulva]KAK4620157.1 Tyrosinase ustQ [Fulvia fulva]KAK4620692.1 Tyrosinase ustQ [Fulvia fulva]UJO19594.1 Tyrosinase ustQ [Fulvia fulva]WPV16878.1 Tyrosinase ustQ [Fulvia fulva]WPV32279.1 Tyrosinase ustQ [Fulvia fulva]